ncbi:MAG: hypothetical protein HYW24_00560 [Candidatus Aenigmarchaeota archaeon]|nr:hypothetical protein [Candidatus Aenigmarchaeota archaeon]
MEQETLAKLEPSVDLGILVGLLLTDGSVTFNSRSWRIVFSGKSEELRELFKQKMKLLFSIEKFSEWTDEFGVKSLQVRQKQAASQLLRLVPTFRTKPFKDGTFPQVRLPEFFEKMSTREMAEIMKAMFSADGSIVLGVKWRQDKKMWVFTRRICLTSVTPSLKEQIAEILEKRFGMKPQIWRSDVALERKSDILKFKEVIGFVKGVKISKKSKVWEGFEKTQILGLAIKTFDLKKKDLQKFKTKEDVISFLKSLMAPATVAS